MAIQIYIWQYKYTFGNTNIGYVLVGTDDQRRIVTKLQRMDCQMIVDQNNYALKRQAGYFNDDDGDDDDVLFKVQLTVRRDIAVIYELRRFTFFY
jgi:hypothetical protein